MGRTFLNAVMALLFVVFYTSCSKEVKHQVLELVEYDSISVAIDYPILSNYVRLVPYVRNGELFVVGYNHFEHYYDFVNLSGGKHFSVELSDENHRMLFIPRGFAHGFSVLSEEVVFQYKCDNYYHPESEGAIAWNDPDLGIDWGIPSDKVILSVKDAKNPLLKDMK